MQALSTRTKASVGSWMLGSVTLSTRMSPAPWMMVALMGFLSLRLAFVWRPLSSLRSATAQERAESGARRSVASGLLGMAGLELSGVLMLVLVQSHDRS